MRGALTLVYPGTVTRWRDARGRFVAASVAERMSPTERRRVGLWRQQFSRTAKGVLGPRAAPLLAALRAVEAGDLDWRQLLDETVQRLIQLGLVA